MPKSEHPIADAFYLWIHEFEKENNLNSTESLMIEEEWFEMYLELAREVIE